MIQPKFKQTEIGKIPVDWDVKILDDKLVSLNDNSISKEFNFEEIRYYDTSSVTRGRFNLPETYNIKKAPSRAKRLAKKGDIVISTVRPNQEHYGYVSEVRPNDIFSTGFVIISCKDINSRYLYNYLKSQKIITRLQQIAESHTSTYPSFRPGDLKKIKIPIPSPHEQEAIASILLKLDEKIDLNNKTNETLEAIGQALFKGWFIDNPEKVKWKISTIGKELKTILGGTPSRTNPKYWGGNVNWINSGKVNEFRIIEPSERITEEGLRHSATAMLPKGTVVLAITGATLGQVSKLEIDSCSNQSVIGIIESGNLSSEYIYFWIKNKIQDIISHQTGGAQQHINKSNVDNYELLIPNENLMSEFNNIIRPIFDQISKNCFESQTLSQIRDTLLPKLMSGEIRIPLEDDKGRKK